MVGVSHSCDIGRHFDCRVLNAILDSRRALDAAATDASRGTKLAGVWRIDGFGARPVSEGDLSKGQSYLCVVGWVALTEDEVKWVALLLLPNRPQ